METETGDSAAVLPPAPPPPPQLGQPPQPQLVQPQQQQPRPLSELRAHSLSRTSPTQRWRTAAQAARALAAAAAADSGGQHSQPLQQQPDQQQQRTRQQPRALLAEQPATSSTAADVGLPRFCQPPGLDVDRMDRIEEALRRRRSSSCVEEEEEEEEEEDDDDDEEEQRREAAATAAAAAAAGGAKAAAAAATGAKVAAPPPPPSTASATPASSPVGSSAATTPLLAAKPPQAAATAPPAAPLTTTTDQAKPPPRRRRRGPRPQPDAAASRLDSLSSSAAPQPSAEAAALARDARALEALRAADASVSRIAVVDYSSSRVRERALLGSGGTTDPFPSSTSDADPRHPCHHRTPAQELERVLAAPRPSGFPVRWIIVHGLRYDVLRVLARALKLHPLAVEDCTKTPQRVKADFYPNFLYISCILMYVKAAAAAAAALADDDGGEGGRWAAKGGGGKGKGGRGRHHGGGIDDEHHRRFHGGGNDGAGGSRHGATSALGGTVSLDQRRVPGIIDEAAAALGAGNGGGNGVAPTTSAAPATMPPMREGPPMLSPLSPMSPRQAEEIERMRREHHHKDKGKSGGGLARLRWWHRPGRAADKKPANAAANTNADDADADAAAAHVMAEQVSMFLTRDNLLVTVFSDAEGGDGVVAPVLERVRSRSTLLTDSEDASMLAHAVLDAIVDHSLPVVGAYAARIDALERRVLSERSPRAAYSRELHLISGDLAVLRRTMVPTQQLVHKLRSPEPVMVMAAAGGNGGNGHGASSSSSGGPAPAAPAPAAAGNIAPNPPPPPPPSPPPPFISAIARTYLSDVLDHVETVVEDVDTLSGQASDVVGLVFASISLTQNNSVQLLAVVSALFRELFFLRLFRGEPQIVVGHRRHTQNKLVPARSLTTTLSSSPQPPKKTTKQQSPSAQFPLGSA
jgi:Mg2+ and Co2+ transporter CorA